VVVTVSSQYSPSKVNQVQVPNMHLALHLSQDMQYYGTTRNVSVMIGEQKHKVHKAHAPHTNSKDRALQLLMNVNLCHSIRMILDEVFPYHTLSQQLLRILDGCPVLSTKFINSTHCREDNLHRRSVTLKGDAALQHAHVATSGGIVRRTERQWDQEQILKAWQRHYNVRLIQGMRVKLQYWGKVTGRVDDMQHTRRISNSIGGFVSVSAPENGVVRRSFYRVLRIVTLQYGSAFRCFFVVQCLQWAFCYETIAAPYRVYEEPSENAVISVLCIEEVDPVNVHFVARGETSWWWNPFIVHFL